MKGFTLEYSNCTSHGEGRVHEYFEALIKAPLQKEQTSVSHEVAHWDDAAQRMIFGHQADFRSVSKCSACCKAAVLERLHPISIGFVAELVNIKIERHISQHIYDRISQKAAYKLARDYTLPMDYYSTKKFIRDLGLLGEKISV
ncbi:UNVERIFIED_CONTAM: hypothetical protein Sindi_0475300, partial [Sesamum indicum]